MVAFYVCGTDVCDSAGNNGSDVVGLAVHRVKGSLGCGDDNVPPMHQILLGTGRRLFTSQRDRSHNCWMKYAGINANLDVHESVKQLLQVMPQLNVFNSYIRSINPKLGTVHNFSR